MPQTLDGPVYEVKQDSDWYKMTKEFRETQDAFFKKINEEYFDDNGFRYYHSEHFGVAGDSEDYEKYKDELKKNPDQNNVYIFKKRSKHYPIFKEMIEEMVKEKANPFKAHDVFGMNNMSGSQWVGDRWFYSVKDENRIKNKDEIEAIEYTDYLQIVMDVLNKEEKDESA